jgi:hypothetical protein
MEQVEKIYREYGYPSHSRLWEIVKSKGITGIRQKDIVEFIKEQEVAQLHKKPAKAHENPITTSDKQIDFQMDLLDLSKYARQNDNHNWILLVIDIFDRKVAAIPLKNKEAATTLVGLKEAFRQLGNPRRVVSDSGSEFKGAVDKFLASNSIIHYKTEPQYHNVLGVVDRMSQTLKSMIQKTITGNSSVRWIDSLPQLIQNYNDTPHSGLSGLSPQEASENVTETRDLTHDKLVASKEKQTGKVKLAIGDHVRIKKTKQTVGHKGYEIRYSIKVFTIDAIDGSSYTLSDGRKFREEQLQKVKAPKVVEDVEERKEEKKDVAAAAKFEHKTDQILKHKESIDQSNRREGLRERLVNQLEHARYGKINW